MKKAFDVIGIENLIMDSAFQIDRIPKPDESVELKDFSFQGGGNAGNAIVALARLGSSCGMVGTVGSDRFGDFCKEDMRQQGIDISHIKTIEDNTTFCVCLADTSSKGRSFLVRFSSDKELSDEEIDESYISSSKYIHISTIPCKSRDRAIRFARRNNVLVSLDAGAWWPDSENLISKTDILIMSEEFYHKLFENDENYEENCKKLMQRGPSIVVITLGSRGCVGADKDSTFKIPSFSGYEIKDTTGAGDVFHGGFLYAHSQGMSTEECARFASAVSYINCTTLGGRAGIPSLKTVEKFLETGLIDYDDIPNRREHYRNAVFDMNKGIE